MRAPSMAKHWQRSVLVLSVWQVTGMCLRSLVLGTDHERRCDVSTSYFDCEFVKRRENRNLFLFLLGLYNSIQPSLLFEH